MDFDLTEIEPKQSNWLELNVRYEGDGAAKFTSPVGQVSGPFVAEFTENGDAESRQNTNRLISEDPDYAGADLPFIAGATVKKTNGATQFGIGGSKNKCSGLPSLAQKEFSVLSAFV